MTPGLVLWLYLILIYFIDFLTCGIDLAEVYAFLSVCQIMIKHSSLSTQVTPLWVLGWMSVIAIYHWNKWLWSDSVEEYFSYGIYAA